MDDEFEIDNTWVEGGKCPVCLSELSDYEDDLGGIVRYCPTCNWDENEDGYI